MPLLLYCREAPANAGEDLGSFERAKTSGDLLLSLHHPRILLPLIVGKGQDVIQECEHFGLMIAFAIIQVLHLLLLDPAALPDGLADTRGSSIRPSRRIRL
jgi:hypothetical protein